MVLEHGIKFFSPRIPRLPLREDLVSDTRGRKVADDVPMTYFVAHGRGVVTNTREECDSSTFTVINSNGTGFQRFNSPRVLIDSELTSSKQRCYLSPGSCDECL